MKRRSLSYHIIRNVLAFCIALFLIVFFIYYVFTRNTIEKTTRANAIMLTDNTVTKIEQILISVEKIPELVANTLESSSLSSDSLTSFMKGILAENPNIYGSIIAFEPNYFPERGTYFAPYVYRQTDSLNSATRGEGFNTIIHNDESYEYFFMDWYQIPRFIDSPYWSEPYFDEGGGNVLMTTYSVPFYTRSKGKRVFAGVVTVDVSLDWLTEIISSVKILETGYAFLISRTGVIVSHPDKNYIMNQSIFTLAQENNQPGMRELGREMIQGKSDFKPVDFTNSWIDSKLWIGYRSLPSSKWSVGVVYPEKEMYASLRKINFILVVLIIAGLLMLTLFIVKIVRKITRPLSEFAKSARLIAAGNFNTKLPEIKTQDEMKELHDSFTFMQKELSVYIQNLKDTTSAKEKIESELRIAREIQMSMIPHSFPPFPDMDQIDLFAVLKSAKEVGGDLYDFFTLGGNRFGFVIGDVSGKGVPASLFMAVTRTLVRSISERTSSPAAIMNSLNKSLSANNESGMFVTLFLGVFDLASGEFCYTNAGHNPPVIILKTGEAKMMGKTKNIPVGMFEDHVYREACMNLTKGDKIFLYTDGVTEAENSSDNLFGEESLMNILRENSTLPPKELIEKMEEGIALHVKGFTQSDDITMMAIEYNG